MNISIKRIYTINIFKKAISKNNIFSADTQNLHFF